MNGRIKDHDQINDKISIAKNELQIETSRSGGPGRQHVNKVETTVILKFDILGSSLPNEVKVTLLKANDSRVSKKGILRIKSKTHKSQKRNLDAALERLKEFILENSKKKKKRIKTKPSKQAKEVRLADKKYKSDLKKSRKKIQL